MDKLNELIKIIGNTPLVEIKDVNVPNGNRIFAKLEYANPTGSHYDRIYLELFRILEKAGEIKRGKTKLIDVSSGNAAISFSWFCKQLGYESYVVLPKRTKQFVMDQVSKNGTTIITSQYNEYVAGAVRTLREYIVEHKDIFCINHSRRKQSLIGGEKIAKEILKEMDLQGLKYDYFIPACGNGITIIGPGRILKKKLPKLKIVTFEDKNAPVGFKNKHPFEYYYRYGIYSNFKRHHLFGTSAWGVYFPFIIEEEYHFNDLVEEVILVKDLEWMVVDKELRNIGYNVGHTSLTSFYLAKTLAASTTNQNYILLFYDERSKYF